MLPIIASWFNIILLKHAKNIKQREFADFRNYITEEWGFTGFMFPQKLFNFLKTFSLKL